MSTLTMEFEASSFSRKAPSMSTSGEGDEETPTRFFVANVSPSDRFADDGVLAFSAARDGISVPRAGDANTRERRLMLFGDFRKGTGDFEVGLDTELE
jgi:hypothetical protein